MDKWPWKKISQSDKVIEDSLLELAEIEKRGVLNPDAPANVFGKLMADVFIVEEDEYSGGLRDSMYILGRYILWMPMIIWAMT
ncbi:hypothetical protein IMSAG049_01442 [Clostridiales bacterium]|nr:hypothetical protein IMSAG049_01442 [Clostridiales bacterium]